jgi:polyisoprenyl-teichoic acid--peptidoglycan teichoic acid transferase
MKKSIIILSCISVILIGALIVLWRYTLQSKIFVKPAPQKTVAEKPPETISQHLSDKTPFDILLLGYGGGNHDGPYLTDSMIHVHVDPTSQKIFLLSIPRDLWVKIPITGTDRLFEKINAAYAIGLDDAMYPDKQEQFKGSDGGGRLVEYAVSQVTGLPVNNFVGVDFSGFVKTIDTLGGVDINIQPAFDDFGYPIEASATATCGHSDEDIKAFTATVSAESDIWTYFSCRYEKVHFDAGETHMDGARALIYVRSRHSAQDGSDFGRANRQRKLLIAVENKIFSIGFIPRVISFMNRLNDDIRTDFTPSDIQALIQHAPSLNNYQIIPLALTDKNYLLDTFSNNGQAILIPRDGENNFTTIRKWIADVFAGKPDPAPAIVQVVNGTSISGLAQKATNTLTSKNIQTIPPKTNDGLITSTTTIIAYNTNIIPSDLTLLKNEFNVTNISYETSTPSGYNVRIIVGTDYNNQ